MQTIAVSVEELLNDPRNSRLHDDANIDAIEKSLAEFGQQKPIVVGKDNVIIAGNGTIAAAKRLGWETIHVVYSDLEGAAATAFGIADNRTSELAAWDYQQLAASIAELEGSGYDVSATGWSDEELGNIIGGLNWSPPEATEGGLDGFDGKPAADEPVVVSFSATQWSILVKATGKHTGTEMAATLVDAVLAQLDDE